MSSFFTIPYIAFLGLILLLISGVYIFLVKKMANQNHQFSSIVGVVTSLADELKRLKEFISNTLIHGTKEVQINNTDLIHVSDNEDSDENNDDDNDDDDSDDDDNDDDDSDDDDNDEIASKLEINNHDDIKYIQISSNIKEDDLIKVSEINVSEKEENNLIKLLNVENVENGENGENVENVENVENGENVENVENGENVENVENGELIKEDDTIIDYKKLPLNKLRSIIVEKGLAEDATKLKKSALLQLLDQNN